MPAQRPRQAGACLKHLPASETGNHPKDVNEWRHPRIQHVTDLVGHAFLFGKPLRAPLHCLPRFFSPFPPSLSYSTHPYYLQIIVTSNFANGTFKLPVPASRAYHDEYQRSPSQVGTRASRMACFLVNKAFALVGLTDKFEKSVSQRCHYHYAFLTDCEGIQRSGGDRSSRILEAKLIQSR